MNAIAHAFLDKSRSLISSDYVPKIDRCLDRLSDDDVWWRPNEASNSIGNLVLHLCGNVTQWILGGVGRRPYERRRQEEFDKRGQIPRADLAARLKKVVAEADDVLAGVTAETLVSHVKIQGYDGTVLAAIYHVVEHFAMHTGQIILITKARTGGDLQLWKPPSGPAEV
jgi:uncharacterized damage-inducible protein DinB